MHRVRLFSFMLSGAFLAFSISSTEIVRADDKLLSEVVDFSGTILFLDARVPGLVVGAVRDGETALATFGETATGSGKAPDGDTIMRIGSISKVFCGATLASLVADGTVGLTDRLQDRLGYDVTVPQKDGRPIRLIDLVTHAAGLPREVPRPDGPPDDPFNGNTRETQIASLKSDPLVFPAGTAVMYSNFAFDLLGATLANVSGKPYADLLKERILDPAGMKDTIFNLRPGDDARVMQGHNFDGSPMPAAKTPTSIECAGGIQTTPNDLLRWIKWNVDRSPGAESETRLLDHAAYLYRDGLTAVVGVDDGGPMDAMGLGWVIKLPTGNSPLILEKSGGLQGMFSYIAIAPTRGAGAFFVMNEFSTSGFAAGVEAINGLVDELAPR
jgi:D-alanyl-D-alanine-carboxypeptidase/D-alanyl-D-alanine-endopeptidase